MVRDPPLNLPLRGGAGIRFNSFDPDPLRRFHRDYLAAYLLVEAAQSLVIDGQLEVMQVAINSC